MPTAAFTTLGCKVNQYETQRILESFEKAGFDIVPFTEKADLYVINTCSVTGQAESKSRQAARRASRQNPRAKIVVTGCAGQMSINRNEQFDAADIVVPNPDKLETLLYVSKAFPELVQDTNSKKVRSENIGGFHGRTRATVKIQDGCSVYCSYCSIPYTRPVMHSRPWPEVVEEVAVLARRGYKEVVLAGVLIGAYGPETGSHGPDFEQLLEILCEKTAIERIRISSIEATQVSDRLISIMKWPNSRIVEHLHIPLQSGSDKVLADMNRPYSKEDYLNICAKLYEIIPNVAITTDIMVGFPTEADEDFEETLRLCRTVGFAKAHIFRFSPRFGTAAAGLGDPICPQAKQCRSLRLMEVTDRTRADYVARFVGKRLEVLVEGKAKGGLLGGHSRNYIEVEFAGPESLIGSIVEVFVLSSSAGTAVGEMVSRVSSRLTPVRILD